MGSLYQRGETWWISYYYRGKQIRESAKTCRKMVAKKLLEEREGEVAKGRQPGVFFDRVTFSALVKDLLSDYAVNGRQSVNKLNQMLDLHLNPFFKGMKAPEITSDAITRYVEQRLEEGAARGTINRELTALKRALNLGAQQTPPKVDRVPHIPMLAENNARQGFFEHEEFESLREKLPPYLRGFVTFGYRTGWRLAEVANLTWGRVDQKQGVVRLERGETKNGEGRTVYLDEELKGVIKTQFAGRRLGCPYVFHNAGGKVRNYYVAWRKACSAVTADWKEVGRSESLEGRLFHDFRRTAVRNMVRAGVPERVAMMISGHKTRSVFDRYNIVSDEDLKRAATQQETYLETRASTKQAQNENRGHP